MSEITLEKTHALLEKLAAYVMSELPTRKELEEKLALKADKKDLMQVYQQLDGKIAQKADKVDLDRVEHKVNLILAWIIHEICNKSALYINFKTFTATHPSK